MTNKNPSPRFVKGDPRINRKGRPRVGLTFAEGVRAYLEETDNDQRRSILNRMFETATQKAIKGNFHFWDALVARGYGKVPDVIEIQPEEKPDLSKLTNQEIETWKRLLQKSKP